jgi:hypothetical protein
MRRARGAQPQLAQSIDTELLAKTYFSKRYLVSFVDELEPISLINLKKEKVSKQRTISSKPVQELDLEKA